MLTVTKRKSKDSPELLYSVDVPTVVVTSPVKGAVDAYVEAKVKNADGPCLVGVPFASSAAASVASAAKLDAWELDRRPRASEAGFSVDEVRALVQDLRPQLDEPEGAKTPVPAED